MEKGSSQQPIYRRILLKLSGEALQNGKSVGLNAEKLADISRAINSVVKLGVQVGLVIGGGNIIRGSDYQNSSVDRITADQMGIMATVINGLALCAALEKDNIPTTVMSAIPISGFVQTYNRHDAIESLEQGHVLIFVGGTGNPLVTTDSAAALRGIEIDADLLLKATKVDGVFSADPIKNPNAEHFARLTYDEVIEKRLGVMDLNAILLCQEHQLPLRVYDMTKENALRQLVLGEEIGTLITAGGKI